MEACCTCATLLSDVPTLSSTTEKRLPAHRRLECCTRVICGRCIHENGRFASYCPYCQIASGPSTLPHGLKEPPSYNSVASINTPFTEAPPPYTPRAAPPRGSQADASDEKAALAASSSSSSDPEPDPDPPADDTLHFLDHAHDTVSSLSLRYGVPAHVLRQTNRLTSDHLLLARRTILIPGAWYRGGVSLSPRPVEGEEEELRKSKICRWMVACKVTDYDVAVLYLDQAGYDLAGAMEAYFADEAWEKENPLEAGSGGMRPKGKGVARGRERPWNRASDAAFLRRSGPSER